MTPEQFHKKLTALQNIQRLEMKLRDRVFAEFIRSNCPYKVGDLLTDENGTMRINRISPVPKNFGQLPIAQLYGPKVFKNGRLGKMRYAYWHYEPKKQTTWER